MATIAALQGKVSIDGLKQAQDDLKGMSGHLQDSATGLKGLIGQGLAFAGGAIGVASVGDAFGFVKDQLFDMISSGKNANAMQAQLVAGLQSTHDASGMTVASLGTLSDKLMGLTGIDDDSVKSAESMLLTFTNIGKGAFPAATQAAADLATKMAGGAVPSAQQMQQAALQLGKALNDPATGMSALQRVGVTFSAQQKDQIKNFLAMGDTAGAQNVILKEMQKEFGGSAEAAGKANGGMAIFSAEIDNAKQTIGQALIPALAGIMQNVEPLVVGFAQNLPGALNTAGNFINALKPSLTTTRDVIGFVATGIGNLAATIRAQGPVIQALEAVFAGIAAAITGKLIVAFVQSIPALAAQAAGWLADAAASAAAAIAELAASWPILAVGLAIAGLIVGIKLLVSHWSDISTFFGNIKNAVGSFIGNALGAIGNFFGNLIGLVITGVKTLLGWYLWPYEQVWNFLQGILPKIGAFLHDAWDTIVKDVTAVVSGIFTYVKWVFTTDLAFIQSVMGAIGGFLHTAWNTIVGDVKGVVSGFLGIFQAIGSGISGAMKGAINLVIGDINAFIRFLDGIQIHIPSIGVGPVHTPAFDWAGLNLGQIPYLARGGSVGASGLFVGAEEGVELLTTPGVYRAPAGSHVYSASDTARMLGGGSGGIPDGPLVIQIAGRTVAQLLWPDLIKEARRSAGIRI